jgi:hypothetical protein
LRRFSTLARTSPRDCLPSFTLVLLSR